MQTEDYQKKLQQFQDHEAAVVEVIARAQKMSALLTNWKTISFQYYPSQTFPSEFYTRDISRLEASEWPSGEQIGKLIEKWHELRQELQAAWEQLRNQTGLQFPPKLFPR